MSASAAIIAALLFAAVAYLVLAPLRRAGTSSDVTDEPVAREQPGARGHASGHRRAELEAARESKYQEIRDCELDYRTGKLSLEDYEASDAQLRAEAVEILNALEAGEAG